MLGYTLSGRTIFRGGGGGGGGGGGPGIWNLAVEISTRFNVSCVAIWCRKYETRLHASLA